MPALLLLGFMLVMPIKILYRARNKLVLMTLLLTMLNNALFIKSSLKARQWLALLFVVCLLANAQASFACDMMPDMSEPSTECCCGLSHRSNTANDLQNQPMSAQMGQADSELDAHCDEPRAGCCVVEVTSVGLSDPASGDELLWHSFSNISANAEQQKTFKQLPDPPAGFEQALLVVETVAVESQLLSSWQDPFRHAHSSPVYKISQRYRL